ncbi:hypothetical protein C8A03DRAFT_10999 [Achaetomium macrosporum]|uniref:F-box domain-containing protein n=1 Tax=Achaetomium macrosporum TaxID=79813 RepID=A0AAN7CK89_9PEZI|nr:hypothetical protein C8A03DRAFT_10999 [Achaetomium macrosporum]
MFRDIKFPQDVAGQGKGAASISAVIIEPGPALPRSVRKKTHPSTGKEKLTPDLNVLRCSFYNEATGTWTFRVHVDCWDLVACRVSDPFACASAWCKSLISLHRDSSLGPGSKTLYPPKAPISTRKTPYGRNYRRASLQPLATFDGLAAELGLDHLPTIFTPVPLSQIIALSSIPSDKGTLIRSNISGRNTDPFSCLPPEILHQIFSFTPTFSLLNLRLASRAVASVSRLPDLPQSFWRSRFLPPLEMGFALPERVDWDQDREMDWRGLYFLLRRALRAYRASGRRNKSTGSSVLARLGKRWYWWERLGGIVEGGLG